MKPMKKSIAVLLAICLAFSFALPASADETQTQGQEETQAQLSPDLVAMVKGMNLEQLRALAKLTLESIRELVYAPVEFAGVVTQI